MQVFVSDIQNVSLKIVMKSLPDAVSKICLLNVLYLQYI